MLAVIFYAGRIEKLKKVHKIHLTYFYRASLDNMYNNIGLFNLSLFINNIWIMKNNIFYLFKELFPTPFKIVFNNDFLLPLVSV